MSQKGKTELGVRTWGRILVRTLQRRTAGVIGTHRTPVWCFPAIVLARGEFASKGNLWKVRGGTYPAIGFKTRLPL